METHIVLTVGATLLCGGLLGLVVARLSNPFQRGLGWLGGMFACGAGAAALLAYQRHLPSGLAFFFATSLVLLAYVFLQVALCELTERKLLIPRLGTALLALQVVANVLFYKLGVFWKFSLITMGIVMAIQATQIFLLLKRNAQRDTLVPARFMMLLLLFFACFNLFRSAVVLKVGVPKDSSQPNPLEAQAAVTYLSVGLGLGFGFFWMAGAEMRQHLEELANTDSLTGVANRRSFMGFCERELLRTARSGEPFSLVLIDLDHFKQINDRYGHSTGDKVLCSVVDCMRESLRNIDLLGRWGGEEFVALLPGADTTAAMLVAERLRTNVEALRIPDTHGSRAGGPERTMGTTISVGVTTCNGGTETLDALFGRCDKALYQVKASGRNRVVYGGR